MGKTKFNSNVSNVQTWEDLRKRVSEVLNGLCTQVNGKLTLKDNMDMSGPVQVTFPNTTNPVKVNHGLNRVPGYFLVVNCTAAMSLFQPQSLSYAWNDTAIYLQSNAVGTATIFIF